MSEDKAALELDCLGHDQKAIEGSCRSTAAQDHGGCSDAREAQDEGER